MNGPQLKELRLARNLNQSELAEFLGDCSGATISRWEGSSADVPQWVSDKLLSSTQIQLPLDLLQQLMTYATDHGLDFAGLLTEALRAYLTQDQASNITAFPQQAQSQSYISGDPPPESIVAEEPL